MDPFMTPVTRWTPLWFAPLFTRVDLLVGSLLVLYGYIMNVPLAFMDFHSQYTQ